MLTTPIAVFCYNRPQHLHVALEALKRCEGYHECPLYIYCDVPRNDEDVVAAAATQAVAQAWTELYGGTVVVREENFHYRNITEGITEMCDKYGYVIVVEDDIVVAPDFITYMRRNLEHYKEEDKVMLISGFMFPHVHPPEPSTFFLPSAFIWGWATWKRAWKHYSWKPDGMEEFLKDQKRRYSFDYNGRYPFSRMLKRVSSKAENPYTWDIQWSFTVFDRGCVGLYPSQSLVWNSGLACGVHGNAQIPSFDGRDILYHGMLDIEDFEKPRLPTSWTLPDDIVVDEKAYQRISDNFKKIKRRKNRKRIVEKIIGVLQKQ
ncbi:MAG: hypothetical protein HN411_00325 [Waddliaceae bacterium]|jgi:hypothetical protein|nr:hypothetical protein [Waddliaceae bacterium]MBT3578976.1 hypothetical protein [Waddliaceae bacterium]MBT4444674.1 hypothetical protein [Waddliaceae bacterium]MBT6929173.1 hypothetical protein [Waddliaceae bacterium]MBT7265147.1 hypothetical protein [Waddliaceae bacterium]